MDTVSKPTILVIVGVTGDLCRRYILPAVEQLANGQATPDKFRLIGITRRETSVDEICEGLSTPGPHDFLTKNLNLYTMDLADVEHYHILKQHLEVMKQEIGDDAKVIFYLSVPPQVSQPIIHLLGESGIANSIELLLEKPFGTDLDSAKELVTNIRKYFQDGQIYRVDHYLAKEMVQNLLVFRECNALFKRTWNKDFIERIDIIASEKIGIEGRAQFYEQTGALRDYQSHLLQLAALVLMEGVDPNDKHAVPAQRLKALRQLHIATDGPIDRYAKRAQYEGYRTEVQNPISTAETFIDLTLASDDVRWQGVPIRMVTGKALDERFTEIVITYKKDKEYESDELHIKVQPDTGISLDLWTKVPGYKHRIEKHSLKMAYQDHYPSTPQAYEQVILDAINSNHSLFVSGDEVLESWRIVRPAQEAWGASAASLAFYAPGTRFTEIGKPTPGTVATRFNPINPKVHA